MSGEATFVALFDRWERVWCDGEYALVPECVQPHYLRHNEAGLRSVTREAYAAELSALREARPGIRVLVHDHSFVADRAWFRFVFHWRDAGTGEARSQAGLQSYRIEDDRLAETWLSLLPLGSTWADPAQTSWTSPLRTA